MEDKYFGAFCTQPYVGRPTPTCQIIRVRPAKRMKARRFGCRNALVAFKIALFTGKLITSSLN